MTRYLNLSFMAKTVALILPIAAFTAPAQSEEPFALDVFVTSTAQIYTGLFIRYIQADPTFQELYTDEAGSYSSVEFGRGETGYRGPRYQLVILDGEGNETNAEEYFIMPLTGKPQNTV